MPRDPSFSHQSLPRIPGYELIAEIGRGGMGVVYSARDLQFDRQVAIKTLLPHADPVRFLNEAKITARLPHPNIPPVYALGTLPDGTPWLAMKLITGKTLQKLLEQSQQSEQTEPVADDAPTPPRGTQADGEGPGGRDLGRLLAIFEQICHAVGYAHAHGVIHRDLKPANVMVGAFGEVQVMDWGLAKVLDEALEASSIPPSTTVDLQATVSLARDATDATTPPVSSATRTGSVLGTPSYMSPEQAAGDIHNLGPRSDVFALGAILCQILTGRPPYMGKQIELIRLQALRGDLREVFKLLDSSGAEPEVIALCKGCLSVQPEDRPASGREVAQEVARIRNEAELRARRAELERAEALVREAEQRKRRRTLQYSAIAVALVLLAGLGVSLWQMSRALQAEALAQANKVKALEERDLKEQERQRAEDNQRQAQKERDRANRERASAVAVRDFFRNDLLQLVNVRKQVLQLRGLNQTDRARHDLTVRELLDLAAEEFAPGRIEAKFPNQPEVQAEVLQTISEAYAAVGEYEKAISFARASVDLLKNKVGPDHPAALANQINLFFIYIMATRYRDAISTLLEVVGQLEKLLVASSGPPGEDPADVALEAVWNAVRPAIDARTLTAFRAEIGVADSVQLLLQLGLGLPKIQNVAELARIRYAANDRRAMFPQLILALAYHVSGQLPLAIAIYEKLVGIVQQEVESGAASEETLLLSLRGVLYIAYTSLSKDQPDLFPIEKRLPLIEKFKADAERLLGPDHPNTLIAMRGLAAAYEDAKRFDEAVTLFEQIVQMNIDKLGIDNPETLFNMDSLARIYWVAGKQEQALTYYKKTLELMRARLGPEHPYRLATLGQAAIVFCKAGNLAEGFPMLLEFYNARVKNLGLDRPETLQTMQDLSDVARSAGKLEVVLPLFEEASLTVEQRRFTNRFAARVLSITIRTAEDARQYANAEIWRRKWLEHLRQQLGPEHPDCAAELEGLAGNLSQQRKWTDAEAVLRECLAIRQKHQAEAWTTFNTMSLLGSALLGRAGTVSDQTEKSRLLAEAEPLLLKSYEGMKAREQSIPSQFKVRLVEAVERLVHLYELWERKDDAARWREKLETERAANRE